MPSESSLYRKLCRLREKRRRVNRRIALLERKLAAKKYRRGNYSAHGNR